MEPSARITVLHQLLEDVDQAVEAAFAVAGSLRDEWNEELPSIDEAEAVVNELIEPIFGRLGACGDLVAISLGGLQALLAELQPG